MKRAIYDAFGSVLDERDLAFLEQVGQETVYPKGTILRNNFKDPMLFCSGVVLVSVFDRPNSIYVPGDIGLTPTFGPKDKDILTLSDEELVQFFSAQAQRCITDVRVVVFPTDCFLNLMDRAPFAQRLLENQSHLMMQLVCYQTFLYHDTTYQAVRYILKIAKAYSLRNLTHAQIALLSGRNRVTVTKVLHEIALAEPELFSESDPS